MKVLMLGWEFPPYFAGGVGVVCEAMTRALAKRGVEITYVMPSGPENVAAADLRLLVASNFAPHVKVARIESGLFPYTPAGYPTGASNPGLELASDAGNSIASIASIASGATSGNPDSGNIGNQSGQLYGNNLLAEIDCFSRRLVSMVQDLDLDFDVVHAHDWTTFPAALAVKRLTGKPVAVHVHITEFDKTGGTYADPRVYATEKAGMEGADCVITVSDFVKQRCVNQYGINPDTIRVIHNGVEHCERPSDEAPSVWKGKRKIALFLGRITLQKGPDYFLEAARKVLEVDPGVTFIMAGTGDMLPEMIERSAELGIGQNIVFPGFVSRQQVLDLYRQADVFIMPSVSEPFGIVPLEAMDQGVPVILSRQSGVSEVVKHAMKVDFWDVDDLAAKILASLSYPTLASSLRSEGLIEAERLNWDAVSTHVLDLYDELIKEAPIA